MCKCINRYMTQSLYVHTRCKITALDLYTMSRRRIQLIKMFVRVAHTITSKCHSTLWQQVIIQMCGTLSESLLILKSEWNREGVCFFLGVINLQAGCTAMIINPQQRDHIQKVTALPQIIGDGSMTDIFRLSIYTLVCKGGIIHFQHCLTAELDHKCIMEVGWKMHVLGWRQCLFSA